MISGPQDGALPWLLCACLVQYQSGCRLDDRHVDAPLGPAHGGGTPTIRRSILEEPVSRKDAPFFPTGTNGPYAGLVYDAEQHRFVYPGQFAVREDGTVEGDPRPLGLPVDGRAPPMRDIYLGVGLCTDEEEACDEFEQSRSVHRQDAVFAVRSTPAAVVVLHGRVNESFHAHSFSPPASVSLAAFDPSTGERAWSAVLEGPVAGSSVAVQRDPRWMQNVLDRFLREGVLVMDVGLRERHFRRGGQRLSYGRGLLVRVEIDASGARTVIARGRWGIIAAEFGLPGPAAARRFFRAPLNDAVLAARSPDGVYRLYAKYEEAVGGMGTHRYSLASYDQELVLRWRRQSPHSIEDWIVDDDGWIFLLIRGPVTRRAGMDDQAPLGLMAVSPGGEVAWRVWIPARPPSTEWGDPQGSMVLMEDDLCYYVAFGADGRSELICLSPRHGGG